VAAKSGSKKWRQEVEAKRGDKKWRQEAGARSGGNKQRQGYTGDSKLKTKELWIYL